MLKIRNFNDFVDFMASHKKPHTISAMSTTKDDVESWTFWIDNKHTQKRKVVRIYSTRELLYGNYILLRGWDKDNASWGHKQHNDPVSLSLDDCGYLRFRSCLRDHFAITHYSDSNGWLCTDYLLINPLKK